MRVAGPFTVESLSPHRMLGVDEHGELIDRASETPGHYGEPQDFAAIMLDQLRTAGVQQAHKQDRISFDSLIPWPGRHVCAEGRYQEGGEAGPQRRAGVFIGPEFGTVQRQDLVEAARGRRSGLRPADRLRLQLRGPRHRVRQAGRVSRSSRPA